LWGGAVLRYAFADMNSYFASVEQAETGIVGPLAVVPMAGVDTTCVIAASAEAKAYGIATGTAVHDAKKLCPTIRLVEARPSLYVEYHERIVAAIERCIHVDHVCSIDEVYGQLLGDECKPDRAAAIAFAIKAEIRQAVGPRIRCSIGIAPNAWLAKVASDMHKPDGLTMILAEQMPETLYRLKLTDLPGIASGMAARLNRFGVHHVHQLCALNEAQMRTAWGSDVLGTIWWQQLRGADLPYRPTRRRMVGHSHVLPPALRTDGKAYAVLVRMVHRAATRMRTLGYYATRLTVAADHLNAPSWEKRFSIGLCRDTLTMIGALSKAWPSRPPHVPFRVAVVLSELVADRSAELPLFPDQARRSALADVMDRINRKYGSNAIVPAGMVGAESSAPVRISFTNIPSASDFNVRAGGSDHRKGGRESRQE